MARRFTCRECGRKSSQEYTHCTHCDFPRLKTPREITPELLRQAQGLFQNGSTPKAVAYSIDVCYSTARRIQRDMLMETPA